AAKAERVQVRDGRAAWHVEQEPAAVAGVSSAPFGRFQDQDVTSGVVGGDGRGGPGRAVPGDHHVRHRRTPSLSTRESNFRCYSSRVSFARTAGVVNRGEGD